MKLLFRGELRSLSPSWFGLSHHFLFLGTPLEDFSWFGESSIAFARQLNSLYLHMQAKFVSDQILKVNLWACEGSLATCLFLIEPTSFDRLSELRGSYSPVTFAVDHDSDEEPEFDGRA